MTEKRDKRDKIEQRLAERPELYAQLLETARAIKPSFDRFLAAKKEAETAFERMREADADQAVAYFRANPLSPEATVLLIHVSHYEQTKERAKAGAKAKLESDPKQAAKAEAHKLWQEQYDGKHPELRTNEQFAAECMRRWPKLTSAKVILGWCTQWNKEAKRKSQPAS